jgi:hypothetical protein
MPFEQVVTDSRHCRASQLQASESPTCGSEAIVVSNARTYQNRNRGGPRPNFRQAPASYCAQTTVTSYLKVAAALAKHLDRSARNYTCSTK